MKTVRKKSSKPKVNEKKTVHPYRVQERPFLIGSLYMSMLLERSAARASEQNMSS